MSGRRGHARIRLALLALVLGSAAARFAAARTFTVPWIAPDEMLYSLLGQSLWQHGTLAVRNLATPYYSLLYPALIGAPMLLDDLRRSIEVVQAVQAVVMSATAVPVYLWARRMVGPRWALAAAVLTVLPPTLAFSGLMMSEALYYPLAAISLVALARLLEQPTAFRQGIFLLAATAAAAVRLQALVLVPTLVAAALLDAGFARSAATLRRLVPLAGGALAAVAGLLAVRLAVGAGVSWQDVLGAYGSLGATASSASARGIAAGVLWHLAGVAVLTLGLPLLATATLVARAAGGHEDDPAARSFLATTAAYVVLLVVEVGAFAATNLAHVSERYLATAAPPLFVGAAVWAAREGPRPRGVVLASVGGLLALLAAIPLRTIASPLAVHDELSTVLLARLLADGHAWSARAALLAGAAVMCALFLLLPHRLLPLALGAVAVGLAALSVAATREVARASRSEQRAAFGDGNPSWIDASGASHVTLLATGDRPWPAVARVFYWNRAVTEALRFAGVVLPLPPRAPAVEVAGDGTVVDAAGAPVARREVVAPSTLTLAGTPLAGLPAGSSSTYGLTLWRVDGPIRVTTALATGFLPNGDFVDRARVVVYGCRRGRLELTLLGKSGAPIHVYVDGIDRGTFDLPSQAIVTRAVPAPFYADGRRPCIYDFFTTGLVGSTRIAYVPSGP